MTGQRITALGPWWLARACCRLGARLVTVSTDYVFPGMATLDGAGASRGCSKFDQFGSPTCTRDLAAAIVELAGSDRYGTWHRTNTGHCSWYELTVAIFELAGMDVEVARQPSSALDRPAPRPAWSVLDQTHAHSAGFAGLPHWRDGLARLLEEFGR